jgi:hypothetical protein
MSRAPEGALHRHLSLLLLLAGCGHEPGAAGPLLDGAMERPAAEPAQRDARAEDPASVGDAGVMERDRARDADGDGEALPEAPCADPLALPLLREAPATLAETQLYLSGSAEPSDFAPHARPFQPAYELWSDGAQKQRFVYLPACSQVDTHDMDYWRFPVGTRFWKEFRRDGQLLETRFIHRYGPGEDDWLYAAYVWDPAAPTPAHARRAPDGARDVNGTTHDVPSERDCRTCHVNLPEPPLSFGAIQLSHSLPGETLRGLAEGGWLSHAPAHDFTPPGDATARAALGYLHANCGHCHNSSIRTLGNSYPNDPAPRLRLSVHDGSVEQTTTYKSMVWVGTFNPRYEAYNRVEPCNPELSSLLLRMEVRSSDQMPPLATEVVHEEGVRLVSSFLRTLHAPGVDSCPGARGTTP